MKPGDKLHVLMVAGDMPSHPVAVAKLAIHLADSGHKVTFAVPAGQAVDVASKAVQGKDIAVVSAGHTNTTVQLNVHGSLDATSWASMLHALQNPIPESMADAADLTAPMFEPLLELMRKDSPDVVVLSHYMWSAAGDAAEAAGIPAVTFVHLPYDPALFLGEEDTWHYPRMLPALPHVAAYPTLPAPGFEGWKQRAWKWLDAKISATAWKHASRRQNAVREARGLRPNNTAGWAGYLATHPAVVLGGPPFGPPAPVPPLAVVVGETEVKSSENLQPEFTDWLNGSGAKGVVYVSMGTGLTLTDAEAREIAGGLGRRLAGAGGPRLLWALRSSEQEKLQNVIHAELGEPEILADGTRSFQDDAVRISTYVPQSGVLSSGCVHLFLSHMGFGACTEGVKAGCIFFSYPGGFDQEFNAARAEEAGFALRAPPGLCDLESLARQALSDATLSEQASRAQQQLSLAGGGQAAVQAVEKFAAMGRDDADALVLPMASHQGSCRHSRQQNPILLQTRISSGGRREGTEKSTQSSA